MKHTALFILTFSTPFLLGFGFKTFTTNTAQQKKMKRVTGIGGIFFKSKEPKKLKGWYQLHLGLNMDQYGTNFEWRQSEDSTKKGFTQWGPFTETTKFF